MSPKRRAELRALCEKATPGPWVVVRGDCASVYKEHARGVASGAAEVLGGFIQCDVVRSTARDECWDPMSVADAEFITVARTALPEALDEIERLIACIKRLAMFVTETSPARVAPNGTVYEFKPPSPEEVRADERERIADWLYSASGIESDCECECDCDCKGRGRGCEPCWPCRFQECINKIRSGEASK